MPQPTPKKARNAAAKSVGPQFVNSIQGVAQYFEVNRRTVYDWRTKGMPVTKGGRYNLGAIQKWRDDNLSSCSSEESELTKIKTKREEMRLQRELRQLVPRELLETTARRVCAECQDQMADLETSLIDGIPAELPAVVLDSIRGHVQMISRNVQDVMDSFSKELADLGREA